MLDGQTKILRNMKEKSFSPNLVKRETLANLFHEWSRISLTKENKLKTGNYN
jgi:hypothetical protein